MAVGTAAMITAIGAIISALTGAGSAVASGVSSRRAKDIAAKKKVEDKRIADQEYRDRQLSEMDRRRQAIANTVGVKTPYRPGIVRPEAEESDMSGVYSAQAAGDVLEGISTGASMAGSAAGDIETVSDDIKRARSEAIKRKRLESMNSMWQLDDTYDTAS
jgi:hypothetical protein